MRNPLHRRLKRQLARNAGRYLGIFALLVVTISVVSGFLSTLSSVQAILDNMDVANAVEDARVETAKPMGDAAQKAVEDSGATCHANWSRDASMSLGATTATVRLYQNRTKVDTPSYFEGRAPEKDNEVALDHTFCSHHKIGVGDTVTIEDKTFSVCGIMVLPDYTALMRTNGDFVMDSISFSVGLLSMAGFEHFSSLPTSYTYSIVFDDAGLSTSGRVKREANIVQALSDSGATVTDMLDRDQNQGISYLASDMRGDGAIYTVFLYVLVAIMAFVFVILTNATIEQESSVIGTLLASGWRRAEILRHYLFLPAFVGLLACVVGNVLGYTLLSGVSQGLYYNSYSIPPYHGTFDVQVFLITSVIPYAMLVGITVVGLARKLGATPLAFLRHEVSHGKRRHNLRLPARLSYASRFRLRLLTRNVPTFVTLFLGVFAGSFLVMFSLSLLPMFEDYATLLADSMPADHIYALKAPFELEMTGQQQKLRKQIAALQAINQLPATANNAGLGDIAGNLASGLHPMSKDGTNSKEAIDQAEKICVYSLEVSRKWSAGMEDVTVYGIQKSSRYWRGLDVSGDRVLIGRGLIEKCGLHVGDAIVLYDKYSDKNYVLVISATTGNSANMNVYMSRTTFNDAFDKSPGWFNGYASDKKLNIDPDYLSSTTTPKDMQKLADQVLDSFGDVVQLILVSAALVFFVVMYLLTKTVLEHSARSISYMKVFGYRDREVRRLYLDSITLGVAVSLVLTLVPTMWAVSGVTQAMLLSYSGNFVITFTPQTIAKDLAIGLGTYVLVALLHMRHLRRIPLALALKTQE